jgi:hypothetical protein
MNVDCFHRQAAETDNKIVIDTQSTTGPRCFEVFDGEDDGWVLFVRSSEDGETFHVRRDVDKHTNDNVSVSKDHLRGFLHGFFYANHARAADVVAVQ